VYTCVTIKPIKEVIIVIRHTYALVRLGNILENIRNSRRRIRPETKLLAIIKANAYGHGIVRVGQYLNDKDEVYGFGVAIAEEGKALREGGVTKPILILGATDPEHIPMVVENDIMPAVFTIETLRLLQQEAHREGKKARFHIKLDTGMRRIGIDNAKYLERFLDELGDCPDLILDGVFTHFAKSESDPAFTGRQTAVFDGFVSRIRARGYHPIIHAANSAAIIEFPGLQYDMVRQGISLYGYHSDSNKSKSSGLIPAMEWHSEVTNVKTIAEGEGVSYGLRFVAGRKSVIATLPVGYGDGYKRCLTNRAEVLIHGVRAKQVGTVCMDQIMIDVTDIPNVRIGDKVVLLGKQGDEEIDADEMADWAQTISYEVLLSISERVPRVYE